MSSLDRLHNPVLVLNASYEPINVCAARRAVVLILKGVASAEEHQSSLVHSSRHSIRVPSAPAKAVGRTWLPAATRVTTGKAIARRTRRA
jgi:hypothetical protein